MAKKIRMDRRKASDMELLESMRLIVEGKSNIAHEARNLGISYNQLWRILRGQQRPYLREKINGEY